MDPTVYTYECLGFWTKIMKKRNSGSHVDIYITTPERKRLRSGAELYKFIENNDKYWSVFDPTEINFDRNGKQAPSKSTKNLMTFLMRLSGMFLCMEAMKFSIITYIT